jgi:type IV secretory pathway component VirB8
MAAGIAKRKVREIESWNTAMLDNVQCRPNNDRRNPVGFEMTSYQADSLMANGTQGT